MGLRDQVETEINAILTDTSDCGFGWPITVRQPDGTTACLTGFSNDVSSTIDPDTGVAVSGRAASVALPLCELEKVFSLSPGLPVGVADESGRPWAVRFDDIRGKQHSFKVMEALPDRAAGLIVFLLETFEWN